MRTQPAPLEGHLERLAAAAAGEGLKETSLLIPVLTPPLQAMADSGSAKVGVEVSRRRALRRM